MTEFAKSYPSIKQGWGILGIFIAISVAAAPVYIILQPLLPPSAMTLIYYLLTMGGTFIFAHSRREKSTGLRTYNVKVNSPKVIVLVAILAIALQIGVIIPIVSLVPMPEFVKDIFRSLAEQDGVFSFVTLVLAAPVLEELLFRGIILDAFLKRYTPLKSILVSSALFGIMHLNPWQFITAFILGSLSGWVYYKTRTLSFCIWIHGVNNLLAFLSLRFLDSKDFDESLVEMYGGALNALIVVFCAITVGFTCYYFLKPALDRQHLALDSIKQFDEASDVL